MADRRSFDYFHKICESRYNENQKQLQHVYIYSWYRSESAVSLSNDERYANRSIHEMGVAGRHWLVSSPKEQEKFPGMGRSELFSEAEPTTFYSVSIH